MRLNDFDGSASLAVLKPEIALVMDVETGEFLDVANIVGSSYERAIQLRSRIVDGIHENAPLYTCAECQVPVRLLMHPESRRFYFKHLMEDGRCSAITRGDRTHEEINAIKYDGAKESRRHREMKKLVMQSLRADERFSQIKTEERITNRLTGAWRQPDVQAMYTATPGGKSIRVVFEIQLSTTYLDVIAARRRFYLEQGGLLFWIFARFDDDHRRLTQDDVFYNNNQNAFVVSEESTQLSVERNEFQLGCVWNDPSSVDALNTLNRATVRFTDLTLDLPGQRAFYFDFERRQTAIRNRIDTRMIMVRNDFEEVWLAMDRDEDWSEEWIWQEFYRGVRDAGVRLPEYRRDPHRILINALYSAKYGRVIGWDFNRFVEVAHLIARAHKPYLLYFRKALQAYGRGHQLVEEDRSGKWRKRVRDYKNEISAGDKAYEPDVQFNDVIAILFPEIFEL